MTIKDALAEGMRTLAKHRCRATFPSRETEELLAWAAGVSREALFAHPESRISAPQARKYRAALRRRVAHAPIEHLTGRADFMGLPFRVTKATLIPRPATETIVEEAILLARRERDVAFIDVGTGSGAIAITLAAAFPESRVLATDLSSAALAVARGNGRARGVSDRVAFVRADLLPDSPPLRSGATIIIANLPYIPATAYRALAPEVRRYEPRSALVGGRDGLVPTKRLIDRVAATRFHGPAHLFFELLPGQCSRVEAYAKKRLPGCRTARIVNAQGVAIGVRISLGAS